MTPNEMYDKCLEKWGMDSQLTLTVEELLELAQAILHLRRNQKQQNAIEHLAEEIADVELMLDELKCYFRYISAKSNLEPFLELVTYYRLAKEQRVERLLGE